MFRNRTELGLFLAFVVLVTAAVILPWVKQ
ncbi:hypothetical protein LCGC14_2814190 [marine sediment metagenome]|uniref:Uncharacterized protein n=1 Tax=marine sediment metagenome TaxID=412755 RepID=A0A0F9BAD8_9ZZZZ